MNKKFLALLGITLIAFVSFLEYTIVTTALPTIQKTFQVSILNLQWVFNIYCIVVAVFMIISGRLGDIYGRRLIFYLGALFLAIGSLGAGLSNHFWELIFFRGVQSLGVAATVTLGAGLVTHIFKEKVHAPMSFYACVTGIGLAIGPFIGGVIVMHWGWRWIFLINIPLLIIAYLCCLTTLSEFKSDTKPTMDLCGSILLLITLVTLIYGLIRGEEIAWTDHITIILGIIFIISLPLLIWVENHQDYPIMNFHFFKKPEFLLGALTCMMGGVLVAPSLFFSPLFLQNVMMFSPKAAGLILLAIPIAVVFFAPLVGKLVARISAKNSLFMGLLIGFISAILHVLFVRNNLIAVALVAFFLVGVAWAINNVASPISAAHAVEPSQSGVAIGTIFSMWNTSAAIMVAVTSVLFHSVNIAHHNETQTGYSPAFQAVFILVSAAMLLLVIVGAISVIAGKNKNLI